MIGSIIIKCPTYKESFLLRKILIELGINWANGWNIDGYDNGIKWKSLWETYNKDCLYVIHKHQLKLGNINSIPHLYSNLKQVTVKEFIKKFVF